MALETAAELLEFLRLNMVSENKLRVPPLQLPRALLIDLKESCYNEKRTNALVTKGKREREREIVPRELDCVLA